MGDIRGSLCFQPMNGAILGRIFLQTSYPPPNGKTRAQGQGCLADSIHRACDSWPEGHKLKLHAGHRAYWKKKGGGSTWAEAFSLWTVVSSREVGGGMKCESSGCGRRKCASKHSYWLKDSRRILSVTVWGWDEKRMFSSPFSASPGSYGVWSVRSLVNTALKVSPTLESLKTREVCYKSKISKGTYIFMSLCLLNTWWIQYSMCILTCVRMLHVFDLLNFI